jgi:hypothetical protein
MVMSPVRLRIKNYCVDKSRQQLIPLTDHPNQKSPLSEPEAQTEPTGKSDVTDYETTLHTCILRIYL